MNDYVGRDVDRKLTDVRHEYENCSRALDELDTRLAHLVTRRADVRNRSAERRGAYEREIAGLDAAIADASAHDDLSFMPDHWSSQEADPRQMLLARREALAYECDVDGSQADIAELDARHNDLDTERGYVRHRLQELTEAAQELTTSLGLPAPSWIRRP